MFKGMDGMKHVGAFLAKSEPQAIQAEEASAQVIMNNCIRCHTQLTNEFVDVGRIDYMMTLIGDGTASRPRPLHWYPIRNLPYRSGCRN